MREALLKLLDVALAVTHAGDATALGLLAAGILLLVLGFRAYRPTAALFAAVSGGFAADEYIRRTHAQIPTSLQLAMAIAALGAFAAGLVWPGLATVVSIGFWAFLAATQLTPRNDPDFAVFIWTLAVALGVILPTLVYSWLPALLVPPVAAILVTVGAWGWYGIHYRKGALENVPVAWLLFASLITLIGWMVESGRLRRAMGMPKAKLAPRGG